MLPAEGMLKKPASLGIDHQRHSGESRNPFSSRITIRWLFISPALAGTNQKRKNKGKTNGFRLKAGMTAIL